MAGEYTKRKLKKMMRKAEAAWKRVLPFFQYFRKLWVKPSIKNRDFTIISNNCWAGRAYQYLDMPYLSPTAGLYFFAPDYIKFVSDLHKYLETPLKFIKAEESKYYEELKAREQTDRLIGVLDDVEIVFLHYRTAQEAEEKWNRRKARVNYDHIILKFSRMNLCTDAEIKEFCALPFSNKFVFNIHKITHSPDEIYWRGKKNETEVLNDSVPFPGHLNLKKVLNKPAVSYPKETGLRIMDSGDKNDRTKMDYDC